MYSTRLLIFAVIGFNSVLSDNKVCDFEDSKCLTEAAGRKFVEFIRGIPGLQPSDPLHQDLIEANLPTIKIFAKDLKYDYHIGCPYLTLESEYEIKGELGSQFIEGKGTCKVDLYDYHFLFHGSHEGKPGKEVKMHIKLKTHELQVEAKGKVHYDFKNLYNGDKEKSEAAHKFANENWQSVDKQLRQPTMEAFMNKYIDNVNAYLDIVSAQDLFSY